MACDLKGLEFAWSVVADNAERIAEESAKIALLDHLCQHHGDQWACHEAGRRRENLDARIKAYRKMEEEFMKILEECLAER